MEFITVRRFPLAHKTQCHSKVYGWISPGLTIRHEMSGLISLYKQILNFVKHSAALSILQIVVSEEQ